MNKTPLFAGLVIDENDQLVEVAYVGDEPCYVINDAGFRRHISAKEIDEQVLASMKATIEGHEDILSDQTAKMLGQNDIFSRAMIENQIKNIDQQFSTLLETGIPEDARAYMGMLGFKIKINIHGEIIEINQPGMIDPDSDNE